MTIAVPPSFVHPQLNPNQQACRMCHEHTNITRIRLHRCLHGMFHLNLGATTLHLSHSEFQMLAAAVDRWYQIHPDEIPENFDNMVDLEDDPPSTSPFNDHQRP